MKRDIPRLDLSDFINGNQAQRTTFAHALGQGLVEFGFVSLVNHGIDRALSKAAYEASAAFFDLPETIKRKYEDRLSGRQRGYTPIGKERAKDHAHSDLKEFWHTGQEPSGTLPANLWPEEIAAFKQDTLALYNALHGVARHIAEALESYLEVPAGTLSTMLTGGNTVLRSIHYPAPTDHKPDRLWAAPHEDINLMTLLIEARGAGLEILTKEGEWLPIHCEPSEIILDTGDMMAQLTNGLLPAVTHQVVAPERVQTSRYSMPFFVHPEPNVLLRPICSPKVKPSMETNFPTATQYLNERLRQNGVLTVDFDPLDDEFLGLDD